MAEHGWQWQKKVTVPNAGTATVALPGGRPLLEGLTLWASSGSRVLTNMTCQPRINGKNYGSSTAFVAAKAADPIMDATATGRVLPVGKGTMTTVDTSADPFDFDVLLTNAGAAPEDITLYFAAIGRDGGSR